MRTAGHFGGFTLYIKDGRVTYETNARGNSTGKVTAPQPLAAGTHHIVVDVIATSPAKPGTPVSTAYGSPFPFTGKIETVIIDLK